jgi:signal transduction histidine kinase/ligand-binding sensor domain-containing protein/CheY-like chemotaxis protein/AraC-like DNA-binding protein
MRPTLLFFIRAFLFLLLSSSFPTMAQPPVLTKVAPPEGVLWQGITGIVQDKEGFMWLATWSGLHRYDGYRHVAYKHDPEDERSLASNYVECVYVSKNGTLWAGTFGNGLDRFDPHSKTFTHFTHEPDNPASLADNIVTSILEDRQGNLWIGTHGGLHQYQPETGTFIRHQHNPKDSNSLSNNQVRVLYEDRQGKLWVGTGSPWESEHGEGGLNLFHPETASFTRYMHNPDNAQSLINNHVRAILEDSRGTFWVGTFGEGLHSMNREDGTFNRHGLDPTSPGSPDLSFNHLNIDGINFIHEDVAGHLWIGTLTSGLSYYDPLTGKLTQMVHTPSQPSILSSNNVWWAYSSQEGVLWFSTMHSGDLYYTDPSRDGFEYQETSAPVWGIVEDTAGNHWVATSKGLMVFEEDPKNGQLRRRPVTLPARLEDEGVYSIIEDREGIFWIGGTSGVWRRDPAGGSFTLFMQAPVINPVLYKRQGYIIYQSRDGYLWVGSGGGTLNRLDPASAAVTTFHYDTVNLYGDLYNQPSVIKEDKSGYLWIGTVGGGLIKLDSQTGQYKRYLTSSPHITGLHEDASGQFWVGTHENGLYLFNQEKDNFYLFNDVNSSRPVVSSVLGMVADEQENLWVSSSTGLAKIDAQGNFMAIYGSEMGLTPETFNYTCGHKGRNGKLFVAGTAGFYSFNPRKKRINEHPPQIRFTDFKLFDQPVLPTEKGLLKVAVEQAREIRLPHNQHTFSFNFTPIHYTNPDKNRLMYILEGYDAVWRQASGDHTASYYRVPTGNYTFRLKASSSEGVWAERALPLIVLPPWWQSWWAYGLYGFSALYLFYGIRRYTIRRERMKHELQIRRLEAEKMQEMDHLKSRFFANISHEFRTPLTLILGPLENFMSRKAADHPDQSLYRIMQHNALRLQQLINHLLDLSKLEAGQMQLDPKPATLLSFLKRLVYSFTSLAERKQIRYTFKYPPGQPVIYFDADKLEKIIANLLSNAFNFTPAGGQITVTVRLETLEPKAIPAHIPEISPNARAVILAIEIQDSGTGIAADQLEKIFDRFYQADTSHTRQQEGTGIGLSLVRELVELHAGSISVTSQPGEGSCFSVRLPLLLAGYEEEQLNGALRPEETEASPLPVADGASLAKSAKENNLAETDLQAPLVLVVEDNADLRYFIRENLQPTYQVVAASDGVEGYKMAMEAIPDLILSDVMMPDMDGITLCRKLKTNEKTAHIPLILLTARAETADKIEGLETGADDYLVKPFAAAELLVRIKNLIDSRRELREHFSRQITLEPAAIPINSVDEQFLQRVMQIIEAHMGDHSFGVEAFCREAGMSRMQLFRKLKALTNHSPGDFIRIMRLKRASDLLAQGAGTIAEVAYQVGFQEPSYFTKCFHKQYGKTPSEFIAASVP